VIAFPTRSPTPSAAYPADAANTGGNGSSAYAAATSHPAAEELRDRLTDWLEPQIEELRRARRELPDELDDRAQDIWEPLLAIADLAGGDWPTRARTTGGSRTSWSGSASRSLPVGLDDSESH
jgi:hypothetical protein